MSILRDFYLTKEEALGLIARKPIDQWPSHLLNTVVDNLYGDNYLFSFYIRDTPEGQFTMKTHKRDFDFSCYSDVIIAQHLGTYDDPTLCKKDHSKLFDDEPCQFCGYLKERDLPFDPWHKAIDILPKFGSDVILKWDDGEEEWDGDIQTIITELTGLKADSRHKLLWRYGNETSSSLP